MTKRDNCRFFCKLSIKIKFYIYGSNKRFLIFCEKLFDFICSKMTSDQGKNLNRSPLSIYYITVDWLIHTHDHTRPPHNQQRTCWHAGRPKSWKKRGCGCNFQGAPLTVPIQAQHRAESLRCWTAGAAASVVGGCCRRWVWL